MSSKSHCLLTFLQQLTKIRSKRITAYGAKDLVRYLADMPLDTAEVRSAFCHAGDEQSRQLPWLSVKKPKLEKPPAIPEELLPWVDPEGIADPRQTPQLLPTIVVTDVIEGPEGDGVGAVERSLDDFPEIVASWEGFLGKQWQPWAEKRRRADQVQALYSDIDEMRRKAEETAEQHELLMAVGLLQWIEDQTTIERHLLVGRAEISLNAARGELTVAPAGDCEALRLELDMLSESFSCDVAEDLDALGAEAADAVHVLELLNKIGNSWRADVHVSGELQKAPVGDADPRLVFAPAVVLRPRRMTAFAGALEQLLAAVEDEVGDDRSPWGQLLAEGAIAADGNTEGLERDESRREPLEQPYFPLAVNLEQETILERLKVSPGVLVKGPPGTGKSHTIANLICHLLAKGERVLVTAQAPKALAVLRGLLPENVQELCVTALGGGREEQRVLEESVQGILDKKNTWHGPRASANKIEDLETRLVHCRAEVSRVEQQLRKLREAETIRTTLPGGYEGTAAAIARQLHAERERFGWFPEEGLDTEECPLDERMVRILYEAPERFPTTIVAELGQHLGEKAFPDPLQFSTTVGRIEASAANDKTLGRPSTGFEDVDDESLQAAVDALRKVEAFVSRATRSLGDTVSLILDDAVVDRLERWSKTLEKAVGTLAAVEAHVEHLPQTAPRIDGDVDQEDLLHAVRRRRTHFSDGGRGGFWIFAPKVVRETKYVATQCRVAGRPCETVDQLRSLEAHLTIDAGLTTLAQQLAPLTVSWETVADGLEGWRDLIGELAHFVDGLLALPPRWRVGIGPVHFSAVASTDGRRRLQEAVSCELARRKTRALEARIDQLHVLIAKEASHADAHPTLGHLLKAVESRDVAAYTAAQARHAELVQRREHWREYQRVLAILDEQNPGLAPLLSGHLHSDTWHEKIDDLRAAWAWAHACGRLRADFGGIDDTRLDDTYARLRDSLETTMEKLVAEKAWGEFFKRLSDESEQHLIAWRHAIKRLGKGTGKYANQYRNDARRHLSHCLSDMPAWVMPLHKLWETVSAKPGLFDTIIVDEASQAGVDSLVLFLLAKRIIVVGDDMQNSPDDVGVNQGQVNQLVRDHLGDFAFGSHYRLDSSLFDHADRAFRARVTLREHFRCVPEIIRFSNTFYGGALVPLRVVPSSDRLDPLKHVYVGNGASESRDSRIHNPAEADAIVDTIAALIADEEYAGKTMGVIALQGRAQAELIARKLAARLPAGEIEGRRIRCGEPPNFQGDQRDVIFLSMVAAPNQNYAARTTADDQRRYNVAMSRGRDQVWLFHSVTLQDLAPQDLRHQLLSFFEAPSKPLPGELTAETLRHAAAGHRELGNQPEPFESWFELDVCLGLLERGLHVQSQVEVGTRRLDLVVEGGGSRLAVECDGEYWHGPDAYADDVARQRQLERAGWVFERVRESAFYADRDASIEKIVKACNTLGIFAWSAADQVRPGDAAAEEQREDVGPRGSEEMPAVDESANDRPSIRSLFQLDEFDEPGNDRLPGDDNQQESITRNDAVPFSGYCSNCGYPDPREASSTNIRSRILEIVKRDGPLLQTSIHKLYVQACPSVQRQGKDILRSLNGALSILLKGGALEVEDELNGKPEGQVIRLANSPQVKRRPVGLRDLEEIPPSEMMADLDDRRTELGAAFSSDIDECSTYLLQRYGGRKLTKKRSEHLRRIVMRWLASREL